MRALFALFIRSLREDSRAKLPPILRTAMVVIVLLILWSSQRRFAFRSAAGRELMAMVMMLNGGFLAIAAVSIFPSAITEEKEDETLPLLRMTNLNPLSILLGKAAPRLLAAMLLLAVQIPFTLLAITLGGVTLEQVLGAYAVLGATAVFLCGLALLASVYCRTALRAGFLTGLVGAFCYAGLPVLAIATSLNRMSPRSLSATTAWEHLCVWVMEANPAYGIGMSLMGGMPGTIAPAVWRNLGGGLIFGVLAWVLFDRYCASVGEPVGRARPKGTARPRRRWAGVPRAWRWALVWKDFHFAVGGRLGFLLRCGLGGLMFLGAYGYVRWTDRRYSLLGVSDHLWRDTGRVVVVLALGTAALELLLLVSRLFGMERRRLTLSSLVGLPWSTWRLIWQKVLGCLPALLPWGLLALAGAGAIWKSLLPEQNFGESSNDEWTIPLQAVATLLYVGLQAILLLLTVVWFSIRIRRGALPAAIAVTAVWNILFSIWVDSVYHRHEVDVLFAGVFLSVPAVLLMSRAVYLRIQLAAAED